MLRTLIDMNAVIYYLDQLLMYAPVTIRNNYDFAINIRLNFRVKVNECRVQLNQHKISW